MIFLIVRVQVSLFVIIYNLIFKKKIYYKYIKIIYTFKFEDYLTSLAELVQRLPSKQKFIGSSPIRCFKI